jgi:pimeloyl-ACP methyl ester carboxylesterase
MLGGRSPESAQAVAKVLLPVLPNARVIQFPEIGHMGPITHPEVVNAAIVRFLGEAFTPRLNVSAPPCALYAGH